MKSCCWILCGLVLFLGVGCGGGGEDIPGDGTAPAAEKLTPKEEAAERELNETSGGKPATRDPGSP